MAYSPPLARTTVKILKFDRSNTFRCCNTGAVLARGGGNVVEVVAGRWECDLGCNRLVSLIDKE